jgi:hypothetical protein
MTGVAGYEDHGLARLEWVGDLAREATSETAEENVYDLMLGDDAPHSFVRLVDRLADK